jgi:hypothetical protein
MVENSLKFRPAFMLAPPFAAFRFESAVCGAPGVVSSIGCDPSNPVVLAKFQQESSRFFSASWDYVDEHLD